MRRKIMSVTLALVMLLAIVNIGGCGGQLSNEEHIERITARVQERLANNNMFGGSVDYNITDFEVFILYDFEENPTFWMVEFFPIGHLYGSIHRNRYYAARIASGSHSHFYREGILDEQRYMTFSGTKYEVRPAVKRDGEFVCLWYGIRGLRMGSLMGRHRGWRL